MTILFAIYLRMNNKYTESLTEKSNRKTPETRVRVRRQYDMLRLKFKICARVLQILWIFFSFYYKMKDICNIKNVNLIIKPLN